MANTHRAADSLPRMPRRRSSSEPLLSMEDLLDALPEDDSVSCRAASKGSDEDACSQATMESTGSFYESSESMGRWASNSSLDYFTAEDDESILRKRVVRFDSVEVREYPVREGDHPNCVMPLTLGWEHTEGEIKRVEIYESYRVLYRREGKPARLTREQREQRIGIFQTI